MEYPSITEGLDSTAIDLVKLMQGEKGNICISIIVPTHRLSPERRVDHLVLTKAIRQAKNYLATNFKEEDTAALQRSLDELYSRIDFNHNRSGIGIFVSPSIKQLVTFFFPVTQKVIVGRAFEIRDLLYEVYYTHPYLVLLLSAREARLFEGRRDHLGEIKGVKFPLAYTDDYIYTRPTRGSSYVGNAFVKEYEKDKSVLQEIRLKHFLHDVDTRLDGFLVDRIPLIVAGAEKDLAYFTGLTHHTPHCIGYIPGNFSTASHNDLSVLTWDVLKGHLDKRKTALVTEMEELGVRSVVTGLPEIWRAVKEGRGLRLLVEKDYSRAGFLLNDNDYDLHLQVPGAAHRVLADAVNDLMETTLEMKGEVVLLENGSLEHFQRIVLSTRY